MRDYFKKLNKYILAFIGIILCFIILLILTSSFPSKWIKENVEESASALLNEGNRKIIYIIEKFAPMEFDNFTDALMINTAYSIDNRSPLYSAMVARKNYIQEITTTIEEDTAGELKSASKYEEHNEVGELYDTVNDEIKESFEYARYWHGYLVFLRPLLLLFNIKELRLMLTVIFACLAINLLLLIAKKIDYETSIIFLLGLISVEYFYMGISLQGCFIFLITMMASIYIIRKYENIKDISFVFFIIGILTNFLDFLTVPMLTFGIPCITYLLMKQKNEEATVKEQIMIFLKTGISWGIGYGLTWLTKWILVDFIYDKNLISTAIKQVLYRSVGIEKITNTKVIFKNIIYMIIPISIIVSMIIVYFVNKRFEKEKNNKKSLKSKIISAIPYIIMSVLPFIWYIVLKNHSYNHAFFTYRNLLITMIAILIASKRIID